MMAWYGTSHGHVLQHVPANHFIFVWDFVVLEVDVVYPVLFSCLVNC
jgi:hypothetical protein